MISFEIKIIKGEGQKRKGQRTVILHVSDRGDRQTLSDWDSTDGVKGEVGREDWRREGYSKGRMWGQTV